MLRYNQLKAVGYFERIVYSLHSARGMWTRRSSTGSADIVKENVTRSRCLSPFFVTIALKRAHFFTREQSDSFTSTVRCRRRSRVYFLMVRMLRATHPLFSSPFYTPSYRPFYSIYFSLLTSFRFLSSDTLSFTSIITFSILPQLP